MGPAKEFLICLRPTRSAMLSDGGTTEENDLVERHFSYLSELTDRGVVRLAGRTEGSDLSGFGIVLLRAQSEQAAHEILQEDPAVVGGVFQAQLFPFRTALCSYPVADREPEPRSGTPPDP